MDFNEFEISFGTLILSLFVLSLFRRLNISGQASPVSPHTPLSTHLSNYTSESHIRSTQ